MEVGVVGVEAGANGLVSKNKNTRKSNGKEENVKTKTATTANRFFLLLHCSYS